eukprot:70125-Chlamydomonas_euryale.AAC.1
MAASRLQQGVNFAHPRPDDLRVSTYQHWYGCLLVAAAVCRQREPCSTSPYMQCLNRGTCSRQLASPCCKEVQVLGDCVSTPTSSPCRRGDPPQHPRNRADTAAAHSTHMTMQTRRSSTPPTPYCRQDARPHLEFELDNLFMFVELSQLSLRAVGSAVCLRRRATSTAVSPMDAKTKGRWLEVGGSMRWREAGGTRWGAQLCGAADHPSAGVRR